MTRNDRINVATVLICATALMVVSIWHHVVVKRLNESIELVKPQEVPPYVKRITYEWSGQIVQVLEDFKNNNVCYSYEHQISCVPMRQPNDAGADE